MIQNIIDILRGKKKIEEILEYEKRDKYGKSLKNIYYSINALIKTNQFDKELLFFDNNLPKKDKKILFKKYVREIDLETSRKCNRKCNYCPNSIYDNRMEQTLMDNEVFLKIINELKTINYSKMISLNLVNEPLLDTKLINRIKTIKKILPRVKISINTNGDYLTKEKLIELEKAGVNRLGVTMQISSGQKYNDEIQKERFEKFFEKLNLKYKIEDYVENKHFHSNTFFKRCNLIVMSNNWGNFGVSRGGSLKELCSKNRTIPCHRVLTNISISYVGDIFICCNIFPEIEINKKYFVDNVKNNDIFDIYFSKILSEWRKILFNFSEKPFPCSTCNEAYEIGEELGSNSDDEQKVLRENFLEKCK